MWYWKNGLILLAFLLIFYQLVRGLVALVRSPTGATRTARALTWRMLFSLCVFLMLIVGFYAGVWVPAPPVIGTV